jgi:ABC-type thiamin/hydroxymethylpyrimidine transport system permease subunit
MIKNKKFTTHELTSIGLFGLLMFILSFLFGSTLNIITGNPAASGFITEIIQGIILTIAILIIKKFGTATIIWTIYGILSMPTNMFGGFPGPYKVILCLMLGILTDTVIYLFKYKKWSLYLTGLINNIVGLPIILYLYLKLNIPGAEIFIKYWPIIITFFFIEFCLGIWIGLKILNKIKNKRVIKLIKR